MTCCLYRHFSASDELLYVGISIDGYARTRSHAKHSRWFSDVARVEVEHLPDRETAIEAEKQAIKAESPRFNVVHNRATGPTQAELSEQGLERRIVNFQPLYSISAAAKQLDLSDGFIKRELDEGRMGFIEVGEARIVGKMHEARRKRMISGWQLIDWIEAQEALVSSLKGKRC